ncbi:MAG: gamma-glutamyl phosphate reductase [marine bacterium B5-7]|nr:MAG: gamma-glutamyl phosphate reductase [marine bacterium B5-7]
MNIQTAESIDISEYTNGFGVRARAASRILASADTGAKNAALSAIAARFEEQSDVIIAANRRDLDASRLNKLSPALIDRLELTTSRIVAMADGLRQIVALPDPVGEISELRTRPSGIRVGRMRVPIGVVAIVYESRPNVTADAAALCLKSGNAVILRGGSEAIHSNLAIAECISDGLRHAGLPIDAVQIIDNTDRAIVGALVKMSRYVDVIVPRGGKGLIERISAEAEVPVIKHLDGICHVYIDSDADRDKAIRVAENSKTRRYGICGAMETLLVARDVADDVLPELARRYRAAGVELRGCQATREIIADALAATEEDWRTEYLAPILSIRVVDGLDDAIEHIETYGSAHTDSIVTENLTRANRFITCVDSSSVMVNASTQFADGFEYGLGAEIGISTNKLHVRGPVGLEGLTTQKYVVYGDGTIRA